MPLYHLNIIMFFKGITFILLNHLYHKILLYGWSHFHLNNFHSFIPIHYFFVSIPVYSCEVSCILLHSCTLLLVPMHSQSFFYIYVYSSMFPYITIHSCLLSFVLICFHAHDCITTCHGYDMSKVKAPM